MSGLPRWRQALPLLVAVQVLMGCLALLWGWLRGIPWWSTLHLDGWVLLGLGGGFLLSAASTALFGILRRYPWAYADWLLDNFLGPLFLGIPLSWSVVLALLSGLCEEAFFRGVLQAEIGLVPAALVFGLLHTGDRRLVVTGLWTVVVGLVLGLSYEVSGNLAAPAAVHTASNFLSFRYLATRRAEGPPPTIAL